MKLFPLLSSLALAGTLSLAIAIPRDLDSTANNALELDKRAPEPLPVAEVPVADADAVEVEKRGEEVSADNVLEERDSDLEARQDNSGFAPRQGRPSGDFRPDNSGRGYGVDYRGGSRPGSYPSGWQWYGRDIGWAPYRGWQPPRRWQPPTVFIRIWINVFWWSPPSYWRDYYFSHWNYQWPVPVHWNWRPRNKDGRGFWQRRGRGYYWVDRRE
ncbi:hypothetical protein JCM8097_001308 [Rhodosporidiobolus ruineniae]